MSTKLEIAKKVISDNYVWAYDDDPLYKMDDGIFNTPIWYGDMTDVYCGDGLIIRMSHSFDCFEVTGLSDSDFAELKGYYNKLRDRARFGSEDMREEKR